MALVLAAHHYIHLYGWATSQIAIIQLKLVSHKKPKHTMHIHDRDTQKVYTPSREYTSALMMYNNTEQY